MRSVLALWGEYVDKRLNQYNLHILSQIDEEKTFGFPINNATQTIPETLTPFNFVLSKQSEPNKNDFVHFFIDDYQFERIWRCPERYVDVLSRYGGIIGFDFSLYHGMPKAMQIWNVYRNRLLNAYFASCGIEVIPSANWSGHESYEFCFEGLPKGGTYVIATQGGMKERLSKYNFVSGLHEMVRRLEPNSIVIYGAMPKDWEEQFPKVKFFYIKSLTMEIRERIIDNG